MYWYSSHQPYSRGTGKAQMGIVRVNGSAGLGARKIESVATRLCPHVLHRPLQTAGGTDNALVSMVLAVFAGVWSAGTDCIMSSSGRGDADKSGRIVRPTDHTKPLRTHCALPCSMWLPCTTKYMAVSGAGCWNCVVICAACVMVLWCRVRC
jgi:hypothetical protein